MTLRFVAGSCVAVVVALASIHTGRAQQAPGRGDLDGPVVLDVQGGQIRVVPIATGLSHPWSLAFLP